MQYQKLQNLIEKAASTVNMVNPEDKMEIENLQKIFNDIKKNVNDIKDAPDDVLSGQKANRNPISSGLISPKTAKYAAFSTALLSIVLFALLGIWPAVFGFFTLFIGYFYSIRRIRLKTIDLFDILSHSLLLSGLPFLIG